MVGLVKAPEHPDGERSWRDDARRRRLRIVLGSIAALFPLVVLTAGQAAADDGCFTRGQGEWVVDTSRGRTWIETTGRANPYTQNIWSGPTFQCPWNANGGCWYTYGKSHTDAVIKTVDVYVHQGTPQSVTFLLYGSYNSSQTISDTAQFNFGVNLWPNQYAWPVHYAYRQHVWGWEHGLWHRTGGTCRVNGQDRDKYVWDGSATSDWSANIATGSWGVSYGTS